MQQLWQRVEELARSVYARKAVVQGAGFFAGLLCSRGLVFGKYAPFGVAAVAAMPQEGLWASALGSFLGYLLPSPAYVPVRYCAALLAVAAIRWSLSELKTVNTHPLFAPAVAFLPLLLTGMTMVFLHGSVTYSAALYVAESFLGCGSAYFLRRCANLLLGLSSDGAGRGDVLRSGPLEPGDIAALTVAAGVLALSCSGVTVSGVSLGRISMILLVLTCARSGGVSGGAVSGVTAGALQGLSTAGLSYLSGAYGLGGLMAGVFAPMGKTATAAAFILSHGVASLQVGFGDSQLLTGAIETAVATVLYMCIPKSRRLGELFGLRQDSLSGGALRANIVMRLRHASQALSGVSASVEEISKKLQSVCAPSLQGVYDKSVE
ncbi:MAG: stage II sporulation protein E, partial [Acutalibacter sp.]|nr:stage II sporulation protein E [Acutalibacter sp.]